MGKHCFFLLVNPAVFFEEVFTQMMLGQSVLGRNSGLFSRSDVGLLTYTLARGKVWMFVSAGCILGMSALLMGLAAWKVNPLHSASGRRRGKRKDAD